MLVNLDVLIGLTFLVTLLAYFLNAIRIREIATAAVVLESNRGSFQLLDQSVHLRKLSLSRDSRGRWGFWRQYRFDYSLEGFDRRQGYIIMLGENVQSLVFSERKV